MKTSVCKTTTWMFFMLMIPVFVFCQIDDPGGDPDAVSVPVDVVCHY